MDMNHIPRLVTPIREKITVTNGTATPVSFKRRWRRTTWLQPGESLTFRRVVWKSLARKLLPFLLILALVSCGRPAGPSVPHEPLPDSPAAVDHPGEQLTWPAAPTAAGPTVEPDASHLMGDDDPPDPPNPHAPYCAEHPHDPPHHLWHQHSYHRATEGHMHSRSMGGMDECRTD